jgi:pyruvate dehydrogenase E2 component (dihydrolipoamide acetyltransferase)
VRISPVARRIASENNVDLAGLKGSGPDGRILRRDVEAAGRFGARGFLVCSPETEAEATAGMPFIRPVRSAAQAVDQILSESES